MTSADSPSTPTTSPARAHRRWPTRTRAWSSRGLPCSGRCSSRGGVEKVSRAETEEYFATRGREGRSSGRGRARSLRWCAERATVDRRPVRRGPRSVSAGRTDPGPRRTGVACGWSRRRVEFWQGRTSQAARPAALLAVRRTPGSSNGWRRDQGSRAGDGGGGRAPELDDRHPAAARGPRTGGCGSATGSRSSACSSPRWPYRWRCIAITDSSAWVGLLGLAGLIPLLIFGLVGRRGRPTWWTAASSCWPVRRCPG